MECLPLKAEHGPSRTVYEVVTLIVGMDVSHGSPDSVAAVVSSRGWPGISKYRAAVRSQPAKSEIIEGLHCPDEKWSPKFMLVVAKKNHHTKIFQAEPCANNVPPGTVIDNEICHPTSNDF